MSKFFNYSADYRHRPLGRHVKLKFRNKPTSTNHKPSPEPQTEQSNTEKPILKRKIDKYYMGRGGKKERKNNPKTPEGNKPQQKPKIRRKNKLGIIEFHHTSQMKIEKWLNLVFFDWIVHALSSSCASSFPCCY